MSPIFKVVLSSTDHNSGIPEWVTSINIEADNEAAAEDRFVNFWPDAEYAYICSIERY